MLTQEQTVEIKVLARRGLGIREIARQLGASRNTVRRYLRETGAQRYGPRAARSTKLDAYKEYVLERIEAARPHWIPAPVLLREIRDRGYQGGITQLKAFTARYRVVRSEPVVRFETEPGKQMQADFTVIRRGREPLLALVATLGWSRASFVRFTSREDASTLCAGLIEAFTYFGGVPEQVLFDNAKSMVIERDAYGEGLHRWNAQLANLAKDYGFVPKLCRPYRARTKGKVERFNRYLKSNFVVPLAATLKSAGLRLDVGTANAHIGIWLKEIANVRRHASTGEIPEERLRLEQDQLLALPTRLNPAACVPMNRSTRALPLESLQHPLATYQALLEEVV